MTNALDPVELAAIIYKKHDAIINGKKFKTSRAISCRSFNRYFSVSTDYRPKREGSDSNLLIVLYVQIMPDDLDMQLHRF